MDNEALKQAFRSLQRKIATEVNPDSVIYELYSKVVISADDYDDLCQVADQASRCRKLFALLYRSSHPETFVQLRVALRDEYPWIVDELDKQLTSRTAQPQQPHVTQSTEGEFLLAHNFTQAQILLVLCPVHTANADKTRLSCLCLVGVRGATRQDCLLLKSRNSFVQSRNAV